MNIGKDPKFRTVPGGLQAPILLLLILLGDGEKVKTTTFFLCFTLSCMFTWAMNNDLEFDVLHCNVLARVYRISHNNDIVRGFIRRYCNSPMIHPSPL